MIWRGILKSDMRLRQLNIVEQGVQTLSTSVKISLNKRNVERIGGIQESGTYDKHIIYIPYYSTYHGDHEYAIIFWVGLRLVLGLGLGLLQCAFHALRPQDLRRGTREKR